MTQKTLPRFSSEDEERAFWSNHDSTDYVDWSKAPPVVLPNLKPTRQTISIRMPQLLLSQLKVMAHKRDVPYQSLIKMILHPRSRPEFQNPTELATT